MKKTDIDLIPDVVNPTPDYYCTWQTQLYATSDGKPGEQRRAINENSLFNPEKPYGWAYFHEKARGDLFIVMDDSWDVPLSNDERYHGSLILSPDKFPSYSLESLSKKIKSLGWKGLGGWVCAQESSIYSEGKTETEYWKERIIAANEAGVSYWKVDWGAKDHSLQYRKMLTDLAAEYAPELVIEHSIIKEVIPYAQTFRTYDVPALMSIPMTLEKLVHYSDAPAPKDPAMGLINCEDEAYIAAACGYAMGIMRHPHSGCLPDGRADMSFPAVHRDLKTKMFEVARAARWHRVAPAFSGGTFIASSETLDDVWEYRKVEEEIEAWWLGHGIIKDNTVDGVLTKTAPVAIARNTELPCVISDIGEKPFCVASLNPNGVYSVATLGRSLKKLYCIPKCHVEVNIGAADTVGIFGEYKSFSLTTTAEYSRVLMQDIAGDAAYDMTEYVKIENGRLKIPGQLISFVGREAQPDADTSEPGVVLKLV
ncbi:MAG: hypothetical protein IJ389_02190 [Clostridia bacterium]|nr:hypothetical protein [Clostridia bacterium]